MGRPVVQGQRNFLVPVRLCPWTRAGAEIQGQTLLSRDVPRQNHFPILHIKAFSQKEIQLFFMYVLSTRPSYHFSTSYAYLKEPIKLNWTAITLT